MINSFLTATLITTQSLSDRERLKERTGCIRENIRTRNISNISLLYQYVNSPPLAFGSPAPKVAESIIRSQEYNKLRNNGRNDFKYKDRQFWTDEDGDFPTNIQEPSSNINLRAMEEFSIEFLKVNYLRIDEALGEVIKELYNENADVLTKGRQTWDPFLQRSVTSAEAYREMLNFFQVNLGQSNFNIIGWIKAWAQVTDLDKISVIEKTITKKKILKFNEKTKTMMNTEKTSVKMQKKEITGPNVPDYCLDIATQFCSYLKSKERSKLKRRAIASANMILRMFFEVIERFHLKLGKTIPGSTISMGGVEKQQKIMSSLAVLNDSIIRFLATEDATKWNECLAPSGFFVMHDVFFNIKYRKKTGIPMQHPEEYYDVMREIVHTGIFLLSLKKIHIGSGHVLEDEGKFSRERWYGIDKNVLNDNTRAWYEKIEKDLDASDSIYSPYGMLMGMLNAGSTTYGLVATTRMSKKIAVVRSSDDSISLIAGNDLEDMWENTVQMYWRYKLIGINISLKKTRFFRWPFGEYTSWYIDDNFSSQYGVEISTIRPKGDNPHADFHSAAIETNVSLREFRVNNVGAEMMLALKIANVRRLWRIEKRNFIEDNIPNRIRLLADGGFSPWHSTNTHLSEMGMKKSWASGTEMEKYIYAVCDPENPFSSKEKEKFTFSHEVGAVISDSLDIPRNAFCYIRRPNKTLKTDFKVKEKMEMDACKFLVDFIETIEPSTAILRPTNSISINDYIKNMFVFIEKVLSNCEDDEILRPLSQVKEFLKEVLD